MHQIVSNVKLAVSQTKAKHVIFALKVTTLGNQDAASVPNAQQGGMHLSSSSPPVAPNVPLVGCNRICLQSIAMVAYPVL